MRELQNESIAYDRLFFLDLIHSLTVVPSHSIQKAKQETKQPYQGSNTQPAKGVVAPTLLLPMR